MHSSNDLHSFKKSHTIWIYSLLVLFSATTAFIVVQDIKISPDSMRFGLVSQQILSGNGIRVPIIRLEDTYVPVNGAIPFLDQMPLFPIFLSLLGGLTSESYLSAQIINVICHVLISIFTFLLMKTLCDKWVALLTGLLVSFSYPLLWLTNHICSDSLLIALMMASIYFLILSRNASDNRTTYYLFAAGLFAGVSILARNAGIALIPVFLWEAFVLFKNKRPKSKYISVIAATAIPAIAISGMFVRNYIISGSFRGFNPASPDRPYSEAVKGTISMIFQQVNLGKNAVTLIALIVTATTLYILVSSEARKRIQRYLRSGLDLMTVFIVSYTALICLAMAKQQWNFELRYVSPLVPFLYICGIFSIVFVWKDIKYKGFHKLSAAGIIISLSIIASGNFYKTYLNFSEFLYKQEKAYSILQSCTYKWIKEKYDSNTVITTNRPFHLSFFGGYTTVALPHKRFEPTMHIPENMEIVLPSQMSRFGSHIIALFEEAEERYEGNYIENLFKKRASNDSYDMLYECPDGVIYIMKK